jgi:hypothetical protein
MQAQLSAFYYLKIIIMKKITIYIFLFTGIAFSFLSCTKKYEQLPLDNYTISQIFDSLDINGVYAQQYLMNIYSGIPQPGSLRIGGNGILDAATDDATSSVQNSSIQNMAIGRWSAVSNPDDSWANSYAGIRKCNIFLANIGIVPIDSLIKVNYKAEARFLRAMFYFEMVKRYGGVPLIGDKILSLTDNLNFARNSYSDCVNYIVSECDAIKTKLIADPNTNTNTFGRATQACALALKSRMLLYAASPLNNPANDLGKWQAAADAANALITQGAYTISGVSFGAIFTTRNSKETIMAYQRGLTNDLDYNLAPVGYTAPPNTTPCPGYISPSENLVEAYPMSNGKAITDPTSGYNPNNPYASRDPRLTLTVFTNGALWLKRAVQTYTGGLDMPGGASAQTRTGYYMRKFLADFSNSTAYSTTTHNYIIFRYAEILLNYAEAMNELSNTAVAYTQLQAIRNRAGIAAGTNGLYGLQAGMNQSQMRQAIRLERRLEMAFEEQRFWDLRRWKMAEQQLNNQPLTGMVITKDPTTGNLSYSTTPVFTMVFTPKMYWEPIPYSEITKNSSLTQNSGW